jgi:hypothetical protein
MRLRALMMGPGLLAAACAPPQPGPETTAPSVAEAAEAAAGGMLASTGTFAMTAIEPAGGPALTVTRTVHSDRMAEGQDPHVILRLEASAMQFVELHEANHTPFDLAAQSAGGVLAVTIGAPASVAPVFYRVEQAEGAPLMCGPDGPVSAAAYQVADGALVIVGLTIATFDGEEGEAGITLTPLPADAVCGRLIYYRAE